MATNLSKLPPCLEEKKYLSYLGKEDKNRYFGKITVTRESGKIYLQDPYKINPYEWKESSSLWPKIEMPHIINYLLKNPGLYTLEDMNNYRGLEAIPLSHLGKLEKFLHV